MVKDKKLAYHSSDITPSFINDTLIIFDNVVLNNFGDRNIHCNFLLDTTVTYGNPLTYKSSVNLSAEVDVDTSNNYFIETELVRSSYDPNDKKAIPIDKLVIEENSSSERIVYTIRFQNTGNYPADRVKIIDTLDTNLDIRSFEFIASSHNHTWRIVEENVLIIEYDNIQLPDSTTNVELSQGYFLYTLKLKPLLPIGLKIRNQAAIYFDYNLPIITNTTIHTLTKPSLSSTNIAENKKTFSIIPNIASDEVIISTKQRSIDGYKIFNDQGIEVLNGRFDTSYETRLNIQHLKAGQYFVLLFSQGDIMTGKFIKI